MPETARGSSEDRTHEILDRHRVRRPSVFVLDLVSIGVVAGTGGNSGGESEVDENKSVDAVARSPATRRPRHEPRGHQLRLAPTDHDERPVFWGYFPAFDWVAFVGLFGGLEEMPFHYPQLCCSTSSNREIELGDPSCRPRRTQPHHALNNARWTREAWTSSRPSTPRRRPPRDGAEPARARGRSRTGIDLVLRSPRSGCEGRSRTCAAASPAPPEIVLRDAPAASPHPALCATYRRGRSYFHLIEQPIEETARRGFRGRRRWRAGVEKFAAGALRRRAGAALVEPAAIAERQAPVVAEIIGRADGAVGAGDRLALVVQVGEREVVALANAAIAANKSSG